MASYYYNGDNLENTELNIEPNRRINKNKIYIGVVLATTIGIGGYFLYDYLKNKDKKKVATSIPANIPASIPANIPASIPANIPAKEYVIVIKLRGSARGVTYTIEDLNNNILISQREAPTSWTNIMIRTSQPSIIIKRVDKISNTRLEIESILQDNNKLPQTIDMSAIRGDLIQFEKNDEAGRRSRQNSIKQGFLAWGMGVKYQIDLQKL